MADEDLRQLEEWAGAFLRKLEPDQRRTLAVTIGNKLRRSQMARIRSQQNPDGSAFEPRKKPAGTLRNRRGAIKRNAMFAKLSTSRFFKMQASGDQVVIGFFGRVAKIARVHQDGLIDRVAPKGALYRYPSRVIIGFTAADRQMIRDELIDHLSPISG